MRKSKTMWLTLSFLLSAAASGQEIVQPELIASPIDAKPTGSALQHKNVGTEAAFLFSPLKTITLGGKSLSPGVLPADKAARLFESATPAAPNASRSWDASLYHWRAPLSHHQPLYFEQPALERYGQTYSSRAQPVISAAHFFGCVAALPVKAAIARPASIVYTVGRYRPGGLTPSRLPGKRD